MSAEQNTHKTIYQKIGTVQATIAQAAQNAEKDSYQKRIISQAAIVLSVLEDKAKGIVTNVMLEKEKGTLKGTEAVKKHIENLCAFSKLLVNFLNSEELKTFQEYAKPLVSSLEQYRQGYELIAGLMDGELAPFIQEELEKRKNEFENVSIQDLINDQQNTLIKQVIKNALQRRDIPREKLPPLENILLPLAKATNKPFALKEWEIKEKNAKNELFEFNTAPEDSGKQAITFFKITFDDLTNIKSTKELNDYDKNIYITVGNLFYKGHNVISATQIYKIMNEGNKPTAEQIQRIKDSLEKMNQAYIWIDTEHESKVYKKYDRYRYKGHLLPIDFIDAHTITGGWTYFFRISQEPPLLEFSRKRKQITDMPLKAFKAAISLTEKGATLQDYLRLRIAPLRNPKNKLSKKILYSAIYKRLYGEAPLKDRKEKSRIRENAMRILDNFKAGKWIAGYTIEKDGIIILLEADKKKTIPAQQRENANA